MAYIALYRKWRPNDFNNLVGQEHISKTLVNAIKTGKIAHAYLFSGPRGTGKTSTAKILAKALNCQQGPTPEPCNTCVSCQKINAGSSMDVFEIDAASNRGIDEIRDLRETVKFAPVDGRYKVYIIDEVHMLTTEAFNALLKTLEEPPSHVVFILATTEAHKVPATIHSRCQRYDFKRISVDEIKKRLKVVLEEMKVEAEDEALRLIAVHADGGLRDALSILDQCSTLDDEKITIDKVRKLLGLVGHEWIWKIVDFLADKNTKEILQVLDKLIVMGKDVKQILSEISLHMRAVMIYQAAGDVSGIEVYSDDKTILMKHSAKFTHEDIVHIIQKMHEAINEAKWSPQPRIAAEVALLSICDMPAVASADEQLFLKRIELLEEKINKLSLKQNQVVPVKFNAVPEYREQVQEKKQSSTPKLSDGDVEIEEQEQVPSTIDLDAKTVWDTMLKTLVQSGKRSIYACVSQGKLRGISSNQMIIAFTAGFPKERTEKSDYREILEKILREICHTDIMIRCTLEVAAPPRSKVVTQPQKTVAVGADLPPAEKQVIDTAMQVFGDNFVNQSKK